MTKASQKPSLQALDSLNVLIAQTWGKNSPVTIERDHSRLCPKLDDKGFPRISVRVFHGANFAATAREIEQKITQHANDVGLKLERV